MFQILSSSVAALMAAGAMTAAPADRGTEVVKYGDLNLAQPADQIRMDRRLEKAAMAACGAYDGSVREMKMAVRRSDCYRETLADARARLPLTSAER